MAFCGKCGAQVNDGIKFCPSCGAAIGAAGGNAAPNNGAPNNGAPNNGAQYNQGGPGASNGAQNFTNMFTNTKDHTNEYAPQDIEKGKVMGILAYFGILFWLPLVVCPDSKYGRFHANQGLLLCIIGVGLSIIQIILRAIIYAIFGESFYGLYIGISGFGNFLLIIVGIICYVPTAVLFILGLINAINGKAKELPFVGKIRIIK